jgi:hypothetical protein
MHTSQLGLGENKTHKPIYFFNGLKKSDLTLKAKTAPFGAVSTSAFKRHLI